MIKVNYVNYQTIEKYKDNQWLEVFPESEDTLKHHYFEFYSDDEPIGFWRLRHKDGITNHGNNFVYYEHRGKGWGNKILLISMNVIKEIFPDTKIFYVQCIFTNNRNLHIRDKQFGIGIEPASKSIIGLFISVWIGTLHAETEIIVVGETVL